MPVQASNGTLVSIALLAGALVAPAAHAIWIPTNFGAGADAEVRESAPTQSRGSSTEIASRVRNESIAGDSNDVTDRNSAIYTKFDLSGAGVPGGLDVAFLETAFRMTYRNANLAESRIQDAVTPNPAVRTGLAVYGLDPNAARADWDESTITYENAPGIILDGDIGTKDFTSDLIFLGTVLFPEIGDQNHLPVGQEIVFSSDLLDQFVADAIGDGFTTVTLVSTVIHGGDTPFSDWINFNYLFNPKEQVTLGTDATYDADVMDPMNPLGSPFSGASNADGAFSPSLWLQVIPEPGTASLTLLALTGLAASRRLRSSR